MGSVGASGPSSISHILPNRMGDDQAQAILADFCPTVESAGISIHDPFFGFVLSPNLHPFFYAYELALRFTQEGQYEAHVFGIPQKPNSTYSILGLGPSHFHYPALHGHTAPPLTLKQPTFRTLDSFDGIICSALSAGSGMPTTTIWLISNIWSLRFHLKGIPMRRAAMENLTGRHACGTAAECSRE
ncbi:hypothetical protein C8R43DRAFT_21431 [Mycena crocata]|nr:hypothetical protein C8R43DRAFT_21431 [Mycena crocata]